MGRENGAHVSLGARMDLDPDERLVTEVCRLHFVDELTKSEIADRLSISRFKVADLIKFGRAHGIVRISIVDSSSSTRELETRLIETYRLEQARVSGPTPSTDLEAVGMVAAGALLDTLRDGNVLGIGWGTSVYHTIRSLQERRRVPRVDVVQLAGGVDGVELPLNAIGLATAASSVFGGRLYSLYAPAVVANAQVADTLRQEESLRRTFHQFAVTDCALVGVGGWQGGSSALRQSSALPEWAAKQLRQADVSADVLMHFVDTHAAVIKDGPTIVGPTLDEFLAIRLRLAVAAGPEKVSAIQSALRSGLVNGLATDTATAIRLLGR